MTKLLCKAAKFVWTLRTLHAFKQLKAAFITAPLVPLLGETDISNVAIGVIPSQSQSSQEVLNPCTYYSQKLTPAEWNYEILDKELLAIKSAFK